jgi:hypothetical protein
MSLTSQLDRYLSVRRNLGYDLGTSERILRRFTRFADREGAAHIDTALFLREREKVLDLERGQRLRKSLLAEISMFPAVRRRLFRRAGYSVRNGGAPMMRISPGADRASGVGVAVSGDSQTIVCTAPARPKAEQRVAARKTGCQTNPKSN